MSCFLIFLMLFVSSCAVYGQEVVSSDESHYLQVPFHYQETGYYCGPASLEMVFDFYGLDVPQVEIADAAETIEYEGTWSDKMVRAAHFSNISSSIGNELPWDIVGYSTREIGYSAFSRYGMSLDDLKSLVANGYPIIVEMQYSKQYPIGHYRVAVGYNETHITLHDPWFNAPYQGPNVNMTYSEFIGLWWTSGIFVSPWTVDLRLPERVEQDHIFMIEAIVTYTCPEQFLTTKYPATSVNASISLPDEISLVSFEETKSDPNTLYPSQTAHMKWFAVANRAGNSPILVQCEGKISSYDYSDRIGGSNSSIIRVYPATNALAGDTDNDGSVNIFDVVTISNGYGYETNDARYNPIADIASPYGSIDMFDLKTCISEYGKKYP